MNDLEKPKPLVSISLADIQAMGLSQMNKVIDENEAQEVFNRLQQRLAMRIDLAVWIKGCMQDLETEAAYAAWFKRVDNSVWLIAGVSAKDLPDMDYYDLFIIDTKPARAAQLALGNAGWPQQA